MSENNPAMNNFCGRRELVALVIITILVIVAFATFQGDAPSSSIVATSSRPQVDDNNNPEYDKDDEQHKSANKKNNNNVDDAQSSSLAVDDEKLLLQKQQQQQQRGGGGGGGGGGVNNFFANSHRRENVHRPFRFHIYKLPRQYVEGAIEQLEKNWPYSICNRAKSKTDYTMLDWRHAHSLFTADVYITRYMRLHPQHTEDPDEADAFIIPMMSHLYNCAGTMHYMVDILTYVYTRQSRHYRRMDHRDHYLFWWRWGMHYGSVQKFWRRVTRYFPNINLISFDLLEIMGRNAFQDFSLALKPKFDRNLLNIIMPYPDFSPLLSVDVPHQTKNDEIHTRKRRFLFYFAGTSTIGGIRRWIRWNCDPTLLADRSYKPTDCVYVDFAKSVTDTKRLNVPTDYPHAMRDSVFCGHAAGDALSSRRPTSAILAGCIPVLICDLCLYAWESSIDYASFAIFIPEADVIAGKLVSTLKRIAANESHIQLLRDNLNKVRPHFVYHNSTPQPGDALDMLAKELERRGMLMRQYRRWFQMNPDLSSDAKDYPVDPPAVMKYVKRLQDGRVDRQDAERLKNFKTL